MEISGNHFIMTLEESNRFKKEINMLRETCNSLRTLNEKLLEKVKALKIERDDLEYKLSLVESKGGRM